MMIYSKYNVPITIFGKAVTTFGKLYNIQCTVMCFSYRYERGTLFADVRIEK